MIPEHDKLLAITFPLLYADRTASIRESCMGWGFECGDGWFKLLWDLSEKLEKIIATLPHHCKFCGNTLTKCECEGKYEDFWPRASQVKEKFGTLRFYMTSHTDEIDEAIHTAARLSAITCENCGETGKLNNEGWCIVLCDKCDTK